MRCCLLARVMIVDDMVVIQEILVEILSLKGHDVIYTANDGQQAIDYFSNNNNPKPDIIILDHRMPGKDGVTTLKELIQIDGAVKVVFVSADESARNDALTFGAIDYLVKPFSVKAILTLIEKITN